MLVPAVTCVIKDTSSHSLTRVYLSLSQLVRFTRNPKEFFSVGKLEIRALPDCYQVLKLETSYKKKVSTINNSLSFFKTVYMENSPYKSVHFFLNTAVEIYLLFLHFHSNDAATIFLCESFI